MHGGRLKNSPLYALRFHLRLKITRLKRQPTDREKTNIKSHQKCVAFDDLWPRYILLYQKHPCAHPIGDEVTFIGFEEWEALQDHINEKDCQSNDRRRRRFDFET